MKSSLKLWNLWQEVYHDHYEIIMIFASVATNFLGFSPDWHSIDFHYNPDASGFISGIHWMNNTVDCNKMINWFSVQWYASWLVLNNSNLLMTKNIHEFLELDKLNFSFYLFFFSFVIKSNELMWWRHQLCT